MWSGDEHTVITLTLYFQLAWWIHDNLQFSYPYSNGAISTRKVFDQCWSAAFVALYDAMYFGQFLFGGIEIDMLTSVQVRNYSSNWSNIHNCPCGFDNHIVEVMYHSHRTEDIDVEHALRRSDVCVNGCHGVGDTAALDLVDNQAKERIEWTHAQFTRTSRRPPVSFCTWSFNSTTDSSLVTSKEKNVMPARARWSLDSAGSTVAMAWMPRRVYSVTRASPMPPWPHLHHFALARTIKDIGNYLWVPRDKRKFRRHFDETLSCRFRGPSLHAVFLLI